MQLSLQVSVSELANTIDFVTTAKFRRNAVVPCMLLESLDPIDRVQGPEPRVLDGWQSSKGLSPSMQYELSCKTTQHLESRTLQANGWKTSRPIPRHVHILLHWVFQRLKVRIEDKLLPCLSLFCPFPCLCSGYNPCLRLYLPFWMPLLPFDKPLLSFFPLDHQTRSSSCHHSGSCACSSPKNALQVLFDRPLPFPFPFPFLLFTWRPFTGVDCQAYSLSSRVQKHDLSSSM